jgi:FkbM family methyltransferase
MTVRKKIRRAIEKSTGLTIFLRGPRGLNVVKDLQVVLPGSLETVFDVGAHQGDLALQYAHTWRSATIHCFEPAETSFDLLREKAAHIQRIKCHRVALSDSDRPGVLYIRRESSNNSLRDYNGTTQGELLTGQEKVSVKSIVSFCRDLGIRHIDFLKIDTEGADLDVLIGASDFLQQGAIRAIQVEVGLDPDNDKHVRLEECKAYLEKFGYRLFGIYEQVHEFPTNRWHLRRCNAVFIADGATHFTRSIQSQS